MKTPTFLNSSLNAKIPKSLINLHLAFCLFWFFGIIIFFHLDNNILSSFNIYSNEWSFAAPIAYLGTFIWFFKQKKLHLISYILYPILIFFWFIPKLILKKGKIYLLFAYTKSLLTYIKQWKKTLTVFSLLFIITISLVTTNNTLIRILAVAFFSYLYSLYLNNFIKDCVQPSEASNENFFDQYLNEDEKSPIIQKIENKKYDDNVSFEEIELFRLNNLLWYNYLFNYIKNHLGSFRGKKSFVIYWLYKVIVYIIATLSFFTFINIELYKINNSNFQVSIIPNAFDFFYYTTKTFSYSNIDSIKPNSIIAKLFEFSSFFCLAILFTIVVISFLFSLVNQRNKEDIYLITKACEIQNRKIEIYVENKYQTNLSKAASEINIVKESIQKLKKILEMIM